MPPTDDATTDETADTDMVRTYVGVIVLEAVIIALLWIFGRMSS
jgi:hypothetical protein